MPEIAERVVTVEERSKSNTHRIDSLEEQQKILLEMNANIRLLAEQNKMQNEKIENIKKDVSDLKDKPSKRWDLIITVLITALVTAFGTAIVSGVLN